MIIYGWKFQRITLYVGVIRGVEGLARPVLCWAFYHAHLWDSHLVEGQEKLKTKVGIRADLLGIGCHITLVDGFIMREAHRWTNCAGVEFETEIEEDPSEPETDPEVVAEPEGEAPVEFGETDTPIADVSPFVVSPSVLLVKSASYFPPVPALGESGDSISVDTVCGATSCLRSRLGTSWR
ncbi:hypothetical protein M9H77_04187 [Catharanthus roseus]|uniref:Uncharacterized protein n=1 Tax=Catharanthus roseus TaxID=4058 RepID=A0ACC0CDJ1_CATRO|nr:hypothetical protein M9H77_04187 [Catharanthus roseus]